MNNQLIQGIVPALVTPFNDDENYSLNLDAVPAIMQPMIDAGVGGFFICGSTGEVLTLTMDERRAMAEKVMEVMNSQPADKQIPVIVHVGATSAENAADLAQHAKTIGAPAVGTLPPMDRDNATVDNDIAYYRAVGAASDLPLYVYWRSDMNKGSIRPKDFLDKMADVPTFAGIKFVDPNFHIMQSMKHLSGGTLNCLTGPDEMFLGGLVLGSDGAIGSTYNIMANHFVSIYRDFQAGRITEAMEKQAQAGELIEALVGFGVVTAGTKAIMTHRGLPVGPCRPGNTLGAHTESGFKGQVSQEELDTLLAIVEKYNLR